MDVMDKNHAHAQHRLTCAMHFMDNGPENLQDEDFSVRNQSVRLGALSPVLAKRALSCSAGAACYQQRGWIVGGVLLFLSALE